MAWLRRAPGLALKAWLAWRLLGPELPPPATGPQSRPLRHPGRTVFVGEREFFVREIGPPEAPPLVLLHGWSFDGEMTFFRIIDGLAERFRLIIPDHRGHGRSDWVRGPYDIGDVADDVAGILETLDVGRASVFGYSMGGLVAQELAHRHPELVAKLVLGATGANPMPADAGFGIAVWLGRTIARISRREFSSISTRVLLRTGSLEPRFARWMWEGLMRRDANLYYEAGNAVRRFDSRPWIGSLGVPTLVIVNAHDQLMPTKAQYELASYFDDDHVVELAGARHEAIMNRAEDYVRLITGFA